MADKKLGGVIISPRTGRPKSSNPKSNRITVRLDDETFRKIENYCEEEKIDKTEAIRRGIEILVKK